MKHDPAGQPSVTKWKVMGRNHSPPPCREGLGVELDKLGAGRNTSLHLATALPALPRQACTRARASAAPAGGREFDLARARAFDRTHASASRPLRRDGLAHPRRRDLWDRIAQRWTNAAFACAGSGRAALQKSRADPRRRSHPRAYARGAYSMRLARRRSCCHRV